MSSSEDAAHRAFLKRTMVKSAATKVDVGWVFLLIFYVEKKIIRRDKGVPSLNHSLKH